MCGSVGLVKLVLSSTVACYVTVYWGVKKEALDSALNEQEELEFNGNSEDSDSESEELQHNRAIPLGHILAGSYKDRGPSELYPFSFVLCKLAIIDQSHDLHRLPSLYLSPHKCLN